MKTSIIKTIAFGLAMTFSMGVQGQVISQYVGSNNNGGAEQLRAIEIFNTTGGPLIIGTGDLRIRERFGNNTSINTWTYSGADFTWEDRGVIVIAAPTSTSNYSDGATTNSELGEYAREMGADAVLYTSILTFQGKHPVEVATNNDDGNGLVVRDVIGDFSSQNSGTLTDMVNYERDLEYLETGLPSTTNTTTTWSNVYGQLSAASTTKGIDPAFTVDDFEGFGSPPANIKLSRSGATDTWTYYDPSQPAGSRKVTSNSRPTCSSLCVIKIESGTDNSSGTPLDWESTYNVPKEIILSDNQRIRLKAGTNSTSFAQSKVKKAKSKSSTANTSVIQERRFITNGWHLVGSPGEDGYTFETGNSPTGSFYWSWDGSNWVKGQYPSKGMGVMAYVNPSYSQSFASSNAIVAIESTPVGEFTWAGSTASGVTPDASLLNLLDATNSSGALTGWNLLSNPYNCGLDFQAVYDDGNTVDIDPAIYIRQPDGTYESWDLITSANSVAPSSVIPPMTSFWVRITSSNSVIATNIDDHGINATTMYNKTANAYDGFALSINEVNNPNNGTNTFFYNHDLAISGFDNGLDVYKRLNLWDGIPEIYQIVGNNSVEHNRLDLSSTQTIQLGTDDLVEGEQYTIQCDFTNSTNNYSVSIEDTYNNTVTDISNGGFTFQCPYENMETDRFILHLNVNHVGLDEDNAKNSFYTFTKAGSIFLNKSNTTISYVKVYNTAGKLINQINGSSSFTEVTCLASDLSKGMYIIEVSTADGICSKKILL